MEARVSEGIALAGTREGLPPGAGRGTGVNVRKFAWMLFNVNEVGPNVNGIILLGGLFVSVSVFNTTVSGLTFPSSNHRSGFL